MIFCKSLYIKDKYMAYENVACVKHRTHWRAFVSNAKFYLLTIILWMGFYFFWTSLHTSTQNSFTAFTTDPIKGLFSSNTRLILCWLYWKTSMNFTSISRFSGIDGQLLAQKIKMDFYIFFLGIFPMYRFYKNRNVA